MIKKIKNWYYNIIDGIVNIIHYLPIIWKDRDWDQYFLFILMKYKLQRMENFHRTRGITADRMKIAHQIKICIILLDRLIKDDYLMKCLEPHEKKWGQEEIKFVPYKDKDLDGYNEMIIIVPNANTPKEKELELKERREVYKRSDMLKIQDLEYLFKYMNKYTLGWWD